MFYWYNSLEYFQDVVRRLGIFQDVVRQLGIFQDVVQLLGIFQNVVQQLGISRCLTATWNIEELPLGYHLVFIWCEMIRIKNDNLKKLNTYPTHAGPSPAFWVRGSEQSVWVERFSSTGESTPIEETKRYGTHGCHNSSWKKSTINVTWDGIFWLTMIHIPWQVFNDL